MQMTCKLSKLPNVAIYLTLKKKKKKKIFMSIQTLTMCSIPLVVAKISC